jgi:hypothetical protein
MTPLWQPLNSLKFPFQIPIGLVKKPFIQPTGTFTRGKQTFTTLTTSDNTAIRLSR